LENSKKPALVHCLHGSDRTGAVVAAYRMTYENWSKEDAIAEFKEERFGYHEKWFPTILEVLQSIDIDSLKSDVNRNK
jgi:protein-tyrosine phosphatase